MESSIITVFSWAYCVWRDSVLDEPGELLLVGVFVLLHQVGHVAGYVHAHDVFPVQVCVELFALHIITREPF